ncbi:cytokine receptor family member b1 isoform X1 [Melanotaenia boesemani]|uniref:cytokine receptor family member b1 isoform X1 n=1 Tax=Melanotaenia boesemani TaxID=1250792 RepID=UPI001C049D06|nr:cytokine receptor family member b1 isoform X1 [Melanotaenia boesemani]XP_041857672.1 cytokine receptor family member b1 isoform X1 [Melanotaenia boesemani]
MRCFLLLYEGLFISSVFALLPAPDKLSVKSVNFHHVLHWEPGPGTPPGTTYWITRLERKRENSSLQSTNQTSFKLKLNNTKKIYKFAVWASYNKSRSPQSKTITFIPFRDTTIGPPELSVTGCGTCLQINITLPKADSRSGIHDLQKFYDAAFKILWRKENERKSEARAVQEDNARNSSSSDCERVVQGTGDITFIRRQTEDCVMELDTLNQSFTLSSLEKGVSYCVQVHTKIRTNKNTEPSGWHCNFTSPEEPRTGPVVLGIVSAQCILVVVLMMAMSCMCYTGFICELKVTRPRALRTVLLKSSIMTPDRTVSNQISINSETSTQRNYNNSTASPPATMDGNDEKNYYEEEEDERHLYLDRAAEPSSYESSLQHSGDVCGSRTLAGPENHGGSAESLSAETEFDQDHDKVEGAEIINNFDQIGVLGRVRGGEEEEEEEEEMKEEKDTQDISDNVNLFSVFVASLAGGCEDQEEDTEESLTDFLKVSSLENLSQKVSETESEDETSQLLRDGPGGEVGSGYEQVHAV